MSEMQTTCRRATKIANRLRLVRRWFYETTVGVEVREARRVNVVRSGSK